MANTLAGEMAYAADTGRAHVDLAGVGFGVRDKFRNGLGRNRWVQHHHQRGAGDSGDWRDVVGKIET